MNQCTSNIEMCGRCELEEDHAGPHESKRGWWSNDVVLENGEDYVRSSFDQHHPDLPTVSDLHPPQLGLTRKEKLDLLALQIQTKLHQHPIVLKWKQGEHGLEIEYRYIHPPPGWTGEKE